MSFYKVVMMQDRAGSPQCEGGDHALHGEKERPRRRVWKEFNMHAKVESKGESIRKGITLHRRCGLLSEAESERDRETVRETETEEKH